MPQNFFVFSVSCKEWNVSFKSSTDMTSHLELPSILLKWVSKIVFHDTHIEMSKVWNYSFVFFHLSTDKHYRTGEG